MVEDPTTTTTTSAVEDPITATSHDEPIAPDAGSQQQESPEMSKRSRKKERKRQEWIDGKDERRQKEREKRKATFGKKRSENPDCPAPSTNRKRLKKEAGAKTKCGIHVVFDMSFDHLMNQKDRGKCIKQLMHCYAQNRRLNSPLDLHVTSFQGRLEQEMERHDGFRNWDLKFHSEHYIKVFSSGGENPESKSLKDVVYLTSESDNVIGETLDPIKVYVIGGLVDHNLHKGICHRLAVESEVSHARLPIDEHVNLKTRKVLTIDHVFKILGGVASESMSWADAFMTTLPARKGAEVKHQEDKTAEK